MSTPHVEIPKPSDIPSITTLVSSDPTHLVPREYEEIKEDLHAWRIIKDGDQVVACGCYDYFSPRIAEVRSVIVDPAHRKKGYAEAIVKQLVKLAPRNQQVFVVTSSPDFFRKMEFSECLGEKYILFYKHIIKS